MEPVNSNESRVPWYWILIGGGGILLMAVVAKKTKAIPKLFNLIKEAYKSVEEWGASRGNQVRAAFGIPFDSLKPEGAILYHGISLDDWNNRKLATLQSNYRIRFENLVRDARRIAQQHNSDLMIWEGSRSLERQVFLYKQGRVPGYGEQGHPVTWTISKGGHLYGMAIDLVIYKNGPSWDFPNWYKTEILPLAKKHGLDSLYLRAGKDTPHIEVPQSEWPPIVAQASELIKKDFPGV